MSLQDLTPQLRTRLSRMERSVGWFVLFAVALLVFGFVYYLYNMAERKGWLLAKAPYYTFVETAVGLKPGDPVKLMGFDAGVITAIKPMPAYQDTYKVYVEFELKSPNYGYIWTEGSRALITTADLLGNRGLEVTKGTGGYPSYVFHPLLTVAVENLQTLPPAGNWVLAQEVFDLYGTNMLAPALDPVTNLTVSALLKAGHKELLVMDKRVERKTMTGTWNYQLSLYEPYTNKASKFWLLAEESPAVTEGLQKLMSQVEHALPGVFALTNQLSQALSNTASMTLNLSEVALAARPAVSNIAVATASLTQPGTLGNWLFPTNINRQLELTLGDASATMQSANTNITALALNLERSLDNLAGITSNLNQQVTANSNILSGISETIIHADQFIQGLKRHWLLRSAFRPDKANAPSSSPPSKPLRSPKDDPR